MQTTKGEEKQMDNQTMSWLELAQLTHATQVERFNFCMCEDNEGQENPYADCPTEEGKCDKCATPYNLSSRDNRCGDCGNCDTCCTHNGEEK